MKKSKLILITSLLTMVLIANRYAGSTNASVSEANVYKQIEKQMPYPEFALKSNLTGKVMVEFTFDENGKIKILNMNYSDAELKSFVTEKLNNMKILLTSEAKQKVYKVAFSFNLI